MFTQPAPAPTSPGLVGTTAAVSAASPASPTSRTSRLRGLSYLRNNIQTHLLSREHSAQHSVPPTTQQHYHQNSHQQSTLGGIATTATITTTTTTTTTTNPFFSPSISLTRPSGNLTRSASEAPTTISAALSPTSSTNSPSSSRANRLSLVQSALHSLGSTSPAVSLPSLERKSTESPPIPPTVAPSLNPETGQAPSSSVLAAAPVDPNLNDMTRTRSATASDPVGNTGGANLDILPSIRFSTFYDPRAARPSLTFTPISRTLPTGSEVIRVGRYSERDSQPNVPANLPSAAPVGFKSKVVSRRHCEFWYEGGKWYIKDVKSSSGTFLNHIRLSPPGTESKPFPVNDGDIVQLGIDFKGGEEMIFRCVKMRLELNRGWQNKLNTFNMTTHKRLQNMTKAHGSSASAQSYSQDCSICLNSIAPCQCLFVAPCSHTWHYKCIRSLLASPQYPIFICPNCRAAADLEAEVEDPEEWEQLDSDDGGNGQQEGASLQPNGRVVAGTGTQSPSIPPPRRSRESTRSVRMLQVIPPSPAAAAQDSGGMDLTMHLDLPTDPNATLRNRPSLSTHATSNPVPIPSARATTTTSPGDGPGTGCSTPNTERRETRTPSPTGGNPAINGHEGPITPRNDAGPWVFDGSGVRMRGGEATVGTTTATAAVHNLSSLDAAAHGDMMDLS